MKIKEVIVVEGEHDAIRLKQVFDVDTIVTNGSAVSTKTISLIKQISKNRDIIVFCDPDYPGEKIRKKIMEEVPQVLHAFIPKEKAISKNMRKVGVEHASDDDLYKALEYVVSFDIDNQSLTYEEYLSLNFIGNKNRRNFITNYLKIAPANAKTLFKRLNMLDLNKDEIIEIMRDYNE